MGVLSIVLPACCPGCGVRAEPLCGSCAARARPAPAAPVPGGLDRCHAPYAYEGAIRELIARAKYRQRHAALPWLAARMVEALPDRGAGFDLVTWVPTTGTRRRARGFDPAETLARAVARRLGPRASRVVSTLRVAGPAAQTGRSRAERLGRVMTVVDAAVPSVGNAVVLLVDDVITTGASMQAAAGALRSAGASRVDGLAGAWTR